MQQFRYRPDVDGLRAIAVGMVILFHLGLAFPGGFVGVDVFFVISGYLITGLILKEQQSGTFSLAGFWVRRIRRIMPAASVTVVVTLAAGWYFLTPAEYVELAESAMAQQCLLANVYFWRTTGYFDGPAHLKPLLQMWSLGVEEQFYIGFPLLLVGLRRIRPALTAWVLILIAALSLGLSEWGVRHLPSSTFFLLPTRAWELLVGGLVNYVPAWGRRTLAEAAGIAGIAAVVAAGRTFGPDTSFPGMAALLPCVGTALLIHSAGARNTIVSRGLAARPLVFVGLLSYSLYLWHWPILAYLRHWRGEVLTTGTALAAIAASGVAAYCSWRFVETPFRQHRAPQAPARRTFQVAAFATVVIVGISAVVAHQRGFPERISTELAAAIDDTEWMGGEFVAAQAIDPASGLPVIGAAQSDQPATVMVWGDSHALVCCEAIDQAAQRANSKVVLALSDGIPPIPGLSLPGDPERERRSRKIEAKQLAVALSPPIRDVVLISRWSSRIEGRNDFEVNVLHQNRGETRVGSSPAEAQVALQRRGTELVQQLRAAGKRVWVVRQTPEIERPIATDVLRHLRFAVPLEHPVVGIGSHQRRQARANEVLLRLADAGATVIDPAEWLVDDSGHVIQVHQSRAVYRDTHHLSRYGAAIFMQPLLAELFARMNSSDSE